MTPLLRAAFLVPLAAAILAGCERPPVQAVQQGFRGTGMVEMNNPRTLARAEPQHRAPAAIPAATPGGPPASSAFKNVPVLGDLGVGEFTRLMVAMTNWVAPEQGCNYCHAPDDLASDKLYPKVVARQMLMMTRQINADWKSHVADTGVTCFTCHRGKPVPAQAWTAPAAPKTAAGLSAGRGGQNAPTRTVGLTSLPVDPLSTFLSGTGTIRVEGKAALPSGPGASIVQTEQTYGLMMHFSQALDVNCTFCHNSRAFPDWSQSPPQRATAWHGIRMVRDLNARHVEPLKAHLPAERLGPQGDVPKVSCATCHQGASKPLLGASMLKDHPELAQAPRR